LDVDRSCAAALTERDHGGEVDGGGQTSTYRFAAVQLHAGVKVKVDVIVDVIFERRGNDHETRNL
jgi:hypothetical protein